MWNSIDIFVPSMPLAQCSVLNKDVHEEEKLVKDLFIVFACLGAEEATMMKQAYLQNALRHRARAE